MPPESQSSRRFAGHFLYLKELTLLVATIYKSQDQSFMSAYLHCFLA